MATSFADGYELREKIAAEGRDPTDDLFILERIPNFFEDLGVLERVGAVSFHVIAESFGLTVTETWDKCALAVQHLRVKYQDRRVYENFERLAERIRGRVERV